MAGYTVDNKLKGAAEETTAAATVTAAETVTATKMVTVTARIRTAMPMLREKLSSSLGNAKNYRYQRYFRPLKFFIISFHSKTTLLF